MKCREITATCDEIIASCEEVHPNTPPCNFRHNKAGAKHYYIDGVEVTHKRFSQALRALKREQK